MKKVIVIGCPGSGKSTFSKKLHDITKIPLFHLDMMYWNSDKSKVDKSLFIQRLSNTLELDEWIIDGDYLSTMELRIQKCDTVFFLDYPQEICLDGLLRRMGKERFDMPWVQTEDDPEFTKSIKKYNSVNRPKVLELLVKYSDKDIVIFKSRNEANNFLNK